MKFDPLDYAPAWSLYWLLFLGTASALVGAWLFQYAGGYPPCMLCLWQRIPHWIAIPLALGAALCASGRMLPISRPFIALAALALFVGAGLAGYHVGVEQKWWPGPASCSIAQISGDFSSFTEGLSDVRVIRCDDIAWSFLGISMAGYNLLISLALTALGLRLALNDRPES